MNGIQSLNYLFYRTDQKSRLDGESWWKFVNLSVQSSIPTLKKLYSSTFRGFDHLFDYHGYFHVPTCNIDTYSRVQDATRW